ncbi:hypothetical protein SLA2020_039730 [Shorea laevis]
MVQSILIQLMEQFGTPIDAYDPDLASTRSLYPNPWPTQEITLKSFEFCEFGGYHSNTCSYHRPQESMNQDSK